MSHALAVAICVPVRNEEDEIGSLLDGIAAQTDCDLGDVTLCLFLDGCSDGSAAIIAARAPTLPYRIVVREGASHSIANAGRARRAAMDVGVAALRGRDGLLLTTDADTVPAPDWIVRSRDALGLADLVAGRIVRRTSEPSPVQDRLESYYDRLSTLRRRLDPVPWDIADPHHFTGGANLGFRVKAYDALGGFQQLRSGEDARIVDDATRLGLRVRRDRASVVHTSSRRTGRAAGGLATHLAHLDRSASSSAVSHPADAVWQYNMQAHARALFGAQRLDGVAALLSLSIDHVVGVARDCPNGEAFAMRIVPTTPGGVRQIGLDEAEIALTALEMDCIGQAA